MKKIEISENAKWGLACAGAFVLWVGIHFVPWYVYEELPRKQEEKAKKTHAYKSLEPLEYNGDTLVFVFHDDGVQREFYHEWKKYRYKNDRLVSDDVKILKSNNDTIKLQFKNQNIQRKFEKEWKSYTGQKLSRTLKNAKKH